MIIGIGTDLVNISDLRNRMNNNPSFIKFVFTPAEREWCDAHFDPAECYAGRFAAKEAFYKALCPDDQDQTEWLDIEVLPGPNGKPEIFLPQKYKQNLAMNRIGQIFLSISHEGEFALAFIVLIEGN